ncbi:hypothetical protein N9937_00915 [bacterium]|nr:hypothetical protein [bacterium]
MTEKSISILYLNWKNSLRVRLITPKSIWFGKTEYHTVEQWLMEAFCHEDNEFKVFALKDMAFDYDEADFKLDSKGEEYHGEGN